jgi:serine/threonine protein kinase/tetratricopeptide (TPR) repeat protein
MNGDARGLAIDEIYFAAVEYEDLAARAAYLAGACGTNVALRRQVERLLDARAERGSFLESPAAGPTIDHEHGPGEIAEGPGTMIGPYKLREQIGEGGMGVVYVAEQTTPVRRKVALKIIKPGMDTKQVIARFEAERQALAMMDHPNIAQVYDAGATGASSRHTSCAVTPQADGTRSVPATLGRPYFVMELVRGIPITDYCDRERLSIPERLELFVQVCRAVQHAHQKGIIHRDLKPSNILVTVIDGAPVPKIIDFGVAKATGASLTERTIYTAFHQFVGTPLYMSPEQADLSGMDVDTRSDIYSLGVLLYEFLTGTTPFSHDTFRTAAFDEVRRIIREQEPPKPSTRLSELSRPHAPREDSVTGSVTTTLMSIAAQRQTEPARLPKLVRGELDWIVMKALEKDRRRRYETANDFAADVTRYLADQPVEACPPSAWYRFGKLARRNRVALVTSALVATALVLGTAVSTWMAVRATRAERAARQQRDAATDAREAEGRARQRAEDAEKTTRIAAGKAKAVNDFLTEDLLTQAKPEENPIEDKVTLLEVVDRAAYNVGERFHDQPESESALRMTLVEVYHGLGAYPKAQRQAQAALEIEQRLHGNEAAGTYHALAELAHHWDHAGRSSEAIEALERASEGLRRTLGPDHLQTLTSRDQLAMVYRAAGRIAEAIALHEETVKRAEATLGPDHPKTLGFRFGLASDYQAAGRTAGAIALRESMLKLSERKFGREHPKTLDGRVALANAYRADGRTDKAIALLEEAVKTMTAKLGLEHPSTRAARNDLAIAYSFTGRTAEAIRMGEELLKLEEALSGPDHPATLVRRGNLAQHYRAVGRTAEAITLDEETLKLSEAKLGPDHLSTLIRRSNLALDYQTAGRTAKALALNEETLKLMTAKLAPDHPSTLVLRINLAECYGTAGRMAEAIALAEDTLKRMTAKKGSEHPDTLNCMLKLEGLYRQQHEYAKAEPILVKALEISRRDRGEEHLETLRIMHNLAGVYRNQGQLAKAEPILAKVLEINRRVRGEEDPVTLTCMNSLASFYWSARKLDRSIPLFEELLKRREAQFGPDHPNTLITMTSLGVNYRDAGRLADATALLEQARAIVRRRPGPPTIDTYVWTALAETYDQAGQFARAEPLHREALETVRKRHGEASLPAASALESSSLHLLKWHKYAEADPLLRECLKVREQKEPDGWKTFHTKSLLGGSLLAQKESAEAEPLLLSGYEGMKQREETIPPIIRKSRLTEAIERLVKLYEATGRREKAMEWRARLPPAAAELPDDVFVWP